VRVQIELRLHCRDHVRVAVAGVEHCDAASEVDVALAFHVPDFGVVGTRGKDLVRVAHAARDGGVAPGHQVGVGAGGQGGVCVGLHGYDPLVSGSHRATARAQW
jgi:hypothetical protein